jgi:hypothetical protein
MTPPARTNEATITSALYYFWRSDCNQIQQKSCKHPHGLVAKTPKTPGLNPKTEIETGARPPRAQFSAPPRKTRAHRKVSSVHFSFARKMLAARRGQQRPGAGVLPNFGFRFEFNLKHSCCPSQIQPQMAQVRADFPVFSGCEPPEPPPIGLFPRRWSRVFNAGSPVHNCGSSIPNAKFSVINRGRSFRVAEITPSMREASASMVEAPPSMRNALPPTRKLHPQSWKLFQQR